MKWLVVALIAAGSYILLTAGFPGIYTPARKALRSRAPKALTQSQVLQNQLADQIAPRLELDPIKRSQVDALLRNLGHQESPELFQARALAGSIFTGALCTALLLFSVPLGVIGMVLTGAAYYGKQQKALEKELAEKRMAIERELPQFASTIRQNLSTTRDVVSILTSYRRVCGPTLAGEIDKTLNDMMTGNAERASRTPHGVRGLKFGIMEKALHSSRFWYKLIHGVMALQIKNRLFLIPQTSTNAGVAALSNNTGHSALYRRAKGVAAVSGLYFDFKQEFSR